MINGRYAICLTAAGYRGSGTLDLNGSCGEGHDTVYQVQMRLRGEGKSCTGTVDILMDPTAVPNRSLPPRYTLDMTGTSADEEFNLIGIGPLGVIVSLSGELADPR